MAQSNCYTHGAVYNSCLFCSALFLCMTKCTLLCFPMSPRTNNIGNQENLELHVNTTHLRWILQTSSRDEMLCVVVEGEQLLCSFRWPAIGEPIPRKRRSTRCVWSGFHIGDTRSFSWRRRQNGGILTSAPKKRPRVIQCENYLSCANAQSEARTWYSCPPPEKACATPCMAVRVEGHSTKKQRTSPGSVQYRETPRTTLLASQKGRVRKRNSTLLTRLSSEWKQPMGASDTEFDRLSRKHPAVLRSILLGVPMVHFWHWRYTYLYCFRPNTATQ